MSPLEIARLALLVAHFIGLAALIGPFLLQLRSREVLRPRRMLIAAIVVHCRRGAGAASVRPLYHVAGGLALADVVVAAVWP